VYKDSFSTSQTTQSVSITKTNPLMLFRKVTAVGRQNNRTVHNNTNMQKGLMLEQMVHIVTAEHQSYSMVSVPRPWRLIADLWRQGSGFDPCLIWVGFMVNKSGTMTGSSPSTSFFSCPYYSTNATCSVTGPSRPL